jgi:2-polyprenyl-3-methyl-5-hydroxy-6-metoxy-1,4-benzoquinol methylase
VCASSQLRYGDCDADYSVKAGAEELEKMEPDNVAKVDYFRLRNVDAAMYEGSSVPPYLFQLLTQLTAESRILDIGCGLGQLLNAFRKKGYRNVYGIDVSDEAVSFCIRKGLSVTRISDITDYARGNQEAYDLIIMSHVVEHIEKSKIIATLAAVRGMLRPTGNLVVMVPNAQSNTGSY